MKLVQLSSNNIEQYGYPCMLRRSIWMRNPIEYRSRSICFLKESSKNLSGIAAVEDNHAIGFIFYGPLNLSSIPVRCDVEGIPTIYCTWIKRSKTKKGIGRAMIQKLKEDMKKEPGIISLTTNKTFIMPFKPFQKMGFKLIHDSGFWKIGFYPIQRNHVEVGFYTPELEWDHVKPFTFITRDDCPFVSYRRDKLKKYLLKFEDHLPIDEIPYKEAKKKDENIIPGFYLFGQFVPFEKIMSFEFKQLLNKAIRDENKKTFGATSVSAYETKR